MARRFLCSTIVTFTVLLIFGSTMAADANSSLLDSLERKLEWLDYRINLERWDFYTKGKADSLQFYERLYKHLTSDAETRRKLKRLENGLSSDSDRRRLEMISDAFNGELVEFEPQIVKLRDSLSSIDINFRPQYNGQSSSTPELYRIYRNNRDRNVREEAYRAWASSGLEMADGLERLFRLRNQAASKVGYNNYLALVFNQNRFDVEEYKKLLERLDQLSRQPYEEILDKAKAKLRVNQLQQWDLGYAYSDINGQVDRLFPVDSQMIFVKRGLKILGFNLDNLPIYFDLDSRPGKSQFAYAFIIKAPSDMRVLANLIDGIHSMRVLMHEIGHAIYSAHIRQESFMLRTGYASCWTEGMAQIMAALLDDPGWLESVVGMDPALVKGYLQSRKEQDIIYLRHTLVRLQFELQAYGNPNRDLNDLYWNLYKRFMLLPEHRDVKEWAAVIHFTTHPVYLQNYLYADIIAAQTMQYLHSNQQTVGDNQNTKSFLIQNYFRFGGRYDWRDILERGT